MYKNSWRYTKDPKKSNSRLSVSTPTPVMAAPLEIDIAVNPEKYEDELRDILGKIKPKWNKDDIKFQELKGGHVNLMLSAYTDKEKKADWLVVRLFNVKIGGDVAEAWGLDRSFEVRSARVFSDIGAGAPLLCIFKNGLVYGFVDGKSFSWEDIEVFKKPEYGEKVRTAVAKLLALVHCQKTYKLAVEKYGMDKAPSAFDMMSGLGASDWGDNVLIDEDTTKWFNDKVPKYEERVGEFQMIVEKMQSIKHIPNTFSHCDCNPTNFIYLEKEEKAILVDLEACGVCSPILDISGFIDGAGAGFAGDPEASGFTPEQIREFLRTYLEERNRLDKGKAEVDEQELDRYYDMTVVYNIGTSFMVHTMMPSLVQAGAAKSYLETGVERLEYYMKNKERMLSLLAANFSSQ